jgi:hypothetical protein
MGVQRIGHGGLRIIGRHMGELPDLPQTFGRDFVFYFQPFAALL